MSALNNMWYLKETIRVIDDDGRLMESIDALRQKTCDMVVKELTSVLRKHAGMPVANVPADLSNRKPNTTSTFCRGLKSRFGAMNVFFDAAKARGVAVTACLSDVDVRERVQAATQKAFTDVYAPFYTKFSVVRFSKKHQQEYTRWAPEDAVRTLLGT